MGGGEIIFDYLVCIGYYIRCRDRGGIRDRVFFFVFI